MRRPVPLACLLLLLGMLRAGEAGPAAYSEVVLENDLVRLVLSADRGAITRFELKTTAPVDLPKHLRHPLSPPAEDAAGAAMPVPVLGPTGAYSSHAKLTHSAAIGKDGAPDTIQNGLSSADTAAWTIAAGSATRATLTYAKTAPGLAYTLTYDLVPGRPSANATLTIVNTGSADVALQPGLSPLRGVHQDYGPVESYYLCGFTLRNSTEAWPETHSFPAVGTPAVPLPLDGQTLAVGLKSRFFAAYWSPTHIGAPLAAPATAAAPARPADDGAAPGTGSMPAAATATPAAGTGPWSSAQLYGYTNDATREHQGFIYVSGGTRVLKPGESLVVPWSITVTSMQRADLARLSEIEAKVEYTDGFHRFFRSLTAIFTWSLTGLAYVVVNYGAAVVLLTILLKLAMFRLTFKQYESMMKMQQLGPELKYIQEQYKNDKQKLAMKQMELFQKHKVNPLGGCLPVLIQIPIFIALYQAFSHSADMRGQSFLWVADLTLPDQLVYLGAHFPSWIPFWANLPVSINPLPILYIAVTIWMSLNQKPPAGNPEDFQVQMAKSMRWMPVIFGVIFYNMPAGLVLYFTVNAVLSTIEIKLVKKKLGMP